jgi:hypothetical protein
MIISEYLFTIQAPIYVIIMNPEIESKLPYWMREVFKITEDAKKENQHKVSTVDSKEDDICENNK